jgi:hypothetical protein
MKTQLLYLLLFYISSFAYSQTPEVKWAKAIGGSGNDRANSIITDNEGNIILVGRFQSTLLQVDDIKLTKNKTDSAEYADVFIIKLDKNGKAIWGISAGNYGDDHALSCVNDSKGNIYVVGWFESEKIKFDRIELTNHNFVVGKDSVRYNSDMWVAKFSPNGKCVWARNAGGLDGNGQYSTITLDKQNNVVISGIAGSEMNFGNGIKITKEKDGMFVAKYSNNGQLLWVKSPDGRGEAQGVATDAVGNVFIGGFFIGKAIFDDITIQSFTEKRGDAFVAKYNSSGKVLWAKSFGGEDGEIASCETDRYGNVYLAGLYFSKVINTQTDTLRNNGLINHFIVKFDKNGKLLWAKSAGGNNGDRPATVTREFYIDDKGNALCTGSNWSEFNFAGKIIKTVSGSEDVLLLKYDKDGKELWGVDWGGSGRNAGRGVTTDKNGNIFLTGSFEEKQFKVADHTLINQGDSDIFIIKLTETR